MPDSWWITTLISIGASTVTAIVCFIGFLITWGGYKEKVDNHKKRLDDSNGKLEKQAIEDSRIREIISRVQATCESRRDLFERNDKDHIEIFSRVNALETGMAALPGKLADRMQEQFEQWRRTVKSDLGVSHAEIEHSVQQLLDNWAKKNVYPNRQQDSTRVKQDESGE